MAKEKEFWITNISKKDVSLSDLNFTIRAWSSVNLLSKHHYYTEDQLNKSLNSGSLFLKRDKLKKRAVPPQVNKEKIDIDIFAIVPSKPKSIFEIKIEKYEELELSNDKEELLKQEFEAIALNVDEELNETPKK